MRVYAAVAGFVLLVAGVVTYAVLRGDDSQQTAVEAFGDGTGDGVNLYTDGETADLGTPVSTPDDQAAPGIPVPSGDADGSETPLAPNTGTPESSGDGTGTPESGGDGSGTSAVDGSSPAPGSGSGGTPAPGTPNPGAEVFEPIRNVKAEFSQYADVPSAQLPMASLTAAGYGSPTPNPISGQFRIHCEYSHFAYDDPIVFPGDPGRSHLHMFFGNTDADAYSNSDSLFDQGGGSCNGYELDRSAYWIPALMNGSTETIVPSEILLYFKTNSPDSVQAFPKGLRVIAGASESDPDGVNRYRWKCEGGGPINFGPFYETIPDCRAMGYDTLGFMLDFPYCWDGENLDSPDHRSHMSYSCSASHPVVFPQLQYIIHFPAPASNAGVHLSSDPLECQTGAVNACGHTLHGDWWNAWHEQTNETWINECSRKRVVCQVPNISATTRLLGAPLYTGPTTLQMPSGSYIPGKN